VAELANDEDDNVEYIEVFDEDGNVEYVELIVEDDGQEEHIDAAELVEEIKDAEPIEIIDDDEDSTAVMEVTDVNLARKKKKIPPA